jgi:RNA recognition motif-containing protein
MPATGRAKLFVGQLPLDATEDEVRELFGCYGVVRGVYLQRDGAGRGKGSAFVTFDTTDEADTAIYTLHGRHKLRTRRKLTVIYAKSSPDISGYGASRGASHGPAADGPGADERGDPPGDGSAGDGPLPPVCVVDLAPDGAPRRSSALPSFTMPSAAASPPQQPGRRCPTSPRAGTASSLGEQSSDYDAT